MGPAEMREQRSWKMTVKRAFIVVGMIVALAAAVRIAGALALTALCAGDVYCTQGQEYAAREREQLRHAEQPAAPQPVATPRYNEAARRAAVEECAARARLDLDERGFATEVVSDSTADVRNAYGAVQGLTVSLRLTTVPAADGRAWRVKCLHSPYEGAWDVHIDDE